MGACKIYEHRTQDCCCVLSDAVSSSDYIASNFRTIKE